MIEIKELPIKGYKSVIEGKDPDSGLHCFIAIHNTTLGPALGGVRIFPYTKTEDALADVLRLSEAMTYKSAVAEDGMGGGKSVIIANPKKDKTEKLLYSFADAINYFKGDYIAAEDVGTTTEDLLIIRKRSPYVCALPIEKSSGDPSRFTAWGVFRGIQAIAKKLWHRETLRGTKILIQGLGSVGSRLANILFWEGANLILSEIDPKKLQSSATLYGAEMADPHSFYETECDILAPCALGGVINPATVPKLRCKAIAGSANNQLSSPEMAEELAKRGILYAPDFIINAGGILNAAAEFDADGYNPRRSRDKVNHIYDILWAMLNRADKEQKTPLQIANEMAEYNLQHGIGKRVAPIHWQ